MIRLLKNRCCRLPIVAMLSATAVAGTIEGHVRARDPKLVLTDVIVSVDDIDAPFPAPTPAAMDQRGLKFVPHVLPVVVGTTVAFPNNDPVAHNVFSISSAKRFNLGLYGPGTVRRIRFDELGIVALLCNVHQEMSAYIVVLKNPYFARVEADGSFRIASVPAGKHQVRWWQERLGQGTREITVPSEGVAVLDMTLN